MTTNYASLQAIIPTPPPAEIIAIRDHASADGSFRTGAYGQMKVDVVVHLNGGDRKFENVKFANPVPADYDIIVELGGAVALSWRGNELRFFVPWMPKVTDCNPEPEPEPLTVAQLDQIMVGTTTVDAGPGSTGDTVGGGDA